MDRMPMRYLTYIDRLIYEYYTTDLSISDTDRESPTFRSARLAELADDIVVRLEQEADHYRAHARRWRGEN